LNTLIFLLTVLSAAILLVTIVARVIGRRPVVKLVVAGVVILLAYGVAWGAFWLGRRHSVVPLGTDICFDDWCATVDSVHELPSPSPDSAVYLLVVRMSNHARGIAQRPSEPRIHIIDDRGRAWTPVDTGPVPLDARLELHESKKARLKFVVPAHTSSLTALIEEGPWITDLLFPEEQPLFKLR